MESKQETVTLDLGSARVRVTKCGDGPPLVLVHGLAASTAWWVRNVRVLGERHTVYLVDLPGFGSMRSYAKQFSVAGCPQWLSEVMSALNLEQAALVGHSMGGLIAAVFAAKYPEKVTKLILAAPAIALPYRSVAPFLIPLLLETIYLPPSFLTTLLGDAGRAGIPTMLRASHEMLTTEIQKELATIAAPALLIFGERDRLVPASLGRRLESEIKGSSLVVLPGAGHIVMYHRAELFNEIVLGFLGNGGMA